jgi:hypothetical protein
MANEFEITLRVVDQFFDRKRVKRSIDKERRKRLSKAGAFVRRGARSKIRKPGVRRQRRKKSGFDGTTSRPGAPPRTHVSGKRSIRLILFAWNPASESVIVGPARFANQMGVNVPRILEHGGRTKYRTKAGETANAHVRPRPFMAPTLAEEAPKFPELFADSVR